MAARVKKRKIVIVDSDTFLAGMYARRFELGAWNAFVAETIDEAKKLIVSKKPEVVIVDLETDPDGCSFIREMNNEFPKTFFVVLTKLGDQKIIKDAISAGADSYLLKGHFVPSEVREKIDRLVSEA